MSAILVPCSRARRRPVLMKIFLLRSLAVKKNFNFVKRYYTAKNENMVVLSVKFTPIRPSYLNKKLDLFKLFIYWLFLSCIRIWTSRKILGDGKRISRIHIKELLKYLHLQLAVSVVNVNILKDYRSSSKIARCQIFKKAMSPDAFSASKQRWKYAATTICMWQ